MTPDTAHLSDLKIQALLDDALQGETARAARAHLSACADCARRVEAQAALFAALESWEESPPPHDLAPWIVQRLAHRRIPFGLSVATAVQAGLALLIVVLAWPLVVDLFSSVPLPTIQGFDLGLSETLAVQAGALVAEAQAAVLPLLDSADAWLRLAPQWMALSPAIVAGALLVAVLGNSILLAGDASGRRTVRPRRL
jgi:hypothetical protein